MYMNFNPLTIQTRQGFLEKKKTTNVPLQSRQICHSCKQHVISSCSTFVPSIIKIFRRVFMLQSRDKKSNSNTRKVSIGQGCPRQNAIQKKVTYVIVTGTA